MDYLFLTGACLMSGCDEALPLCEAPSPRPDMSGAGVAK